MVVWYRLSNDPHSNIVSFFGFVTNDPEGLALVSSRFSRGSATKYLRDNPSAERESLVLGLFIVLFTGCLLNLYWLAVS